MDVIMCIQWKSSKLGCSYYSNTYLELFLMEDVNETKDFNYTTMLIAQVSPKLLMISESSDELLFNFLQEEYGTSIEIKKIVGKYFAFEKGRYLLLNWFINHIQQSVQSNFSYNTYNSNDITKEDDTTESHQNIILIDPEEGNITHAYLQLESLIHLESSKLTIGCAGVLLKHLQLALQECMIENDEDSNECNESVQPLSIRSFSCEMCMHVNSDTIKSLCIFDYETHPNMYQNHSKESLSLFGLLNKTSSVMGKYMLYEWVSRPTRDKTILDYRHEAVSFFLQSSVRDNIQDLCSNLKQMKNFHRILAKVKECKATSNDWQNILKFAYHATRILTLLYQLHKNGGSKVEFIKKFMRYTHVVEAMKVIQSAITNIIDFDSCKVEGRIIVKDGIDNELDYLRKKYESLDDYLLQKALEISATLPLELGATLNLVYFPQLGYLVTLPQYHPQQSATVDDNRTTTGSSHVSDYYSKYLSKFELQFTTMDNLYYKNEVTKELDEGIGDIHAMIADKEIEIIQELSKFVLEYAHQFSNISDVFSELDCILSLTVVALRFNYVKPIMTLDDSLIICQGRHPLQELCVGTFIPNDTYLKGGQGFKSARNTEYKNKDNLSSYFEHASSCIDLKNKKMEETVDNELIKTSIYSFNNKSKSQVMDMSDKSNKQVKYDTSLFEEHDKIATVLPQNACDTDRDGVSYLFSIGNNTNNNSDRQSESESNIYQDSTVQRDEFTTKNYSGDEKEDLNSVQVVTGANFSGKSVYLKQIALIVYMAHIGSFVPANQAVIAITDKLFTRIKTTETVSQPQSAFAFDLQQLQRALNNSSNHSLIIIDEFGKGTDSCDGAALFCSVIGYYLSKGEQCPKIVASTHFHDTISQNILSKEDGITISQTEIIRNSIDNRVNQDAVGDEVVFLYRIMPGKETKSSYGIWCAGVAGLPLPTIKRAITLSETYRTGKPIERIHSAHEQENYRKLEIIRDEFLHNEVDMVDPQNLITSIQTLFKTE